MNNIPALPKIEGDVDILLDIYCHRSLKGNEDDSINEEYGNTDRLVELGGRVLDLTLVAHLFYRRPMLLAEQITDYAREAVSDDKLRTWFTAWNVKSKFRAAPGACEILDSPQEMQIFFKSYIAGLYLRNGFNVVQAWISALIDPEASVSLPPNVSPFSALPPPLGNPPPLPNNAPAPPAGNILAHLNQTATQKGLSVTYPADHLGGPPHAPSWKVSCHINGIKKGEGVGKNQKLAKEEAGRQALQAMGW